jgi:hypothetical protein
MSRKQVRTFFPKTRLSELASRPGGISRADAIEGAMKGIESTRAEGDAVVTKSIADIDALLRTAKSGKLPLDSLNSVLKQADQIVTISGTFGYWSLDKVARSLCDLTDGLINSEQCDLAPVAVHVQSLRLFSPTSGITLGDAEVEKIHGELAKVLAHYEFASLAVPGVAEDDEIVIAAR